MLFAFAALSAQRRIGSFCPESRTHQILPHPCKKVIGITHIIASKCPRDINAIWAGLTITATGTRYFHLLIHSISDIFKHRTIGFCHFSDFHCICNPYIFLNHCHAVHAGQHNTNLRLVPEPAKPPFCRTSLRFGCRKQILSLFRQTVDQPAAPQRFHDNHRNAPFRCISNTFRTGLVVNIHIIILDLTKFPIIGIQKRHKILTVAVVGKSNPTNLPVFLFLIDPVKNSHPD